MWGTVQEGDWVKCRGTVTTGILSSTTLRGGSSGVVTAVRSGLLGAHAEVEFDAGFGTVAATVPTHRLRVVRRAGGGAAFKARQARVTAARAGTALFLAYPTIWWAAQYWWTYRTTDGMTGAFAIAAVDSIGEWANMIVTDPVRTILLLIFFAVLGRFAWR